MATSTLLSQTLLFSYGLVNKSGLLEVPFIRRIFVRSYFLYKSYFEDSIAPFLAKHPAICEGGDIYDVGANIGYTAKIFSAYLSPKSLVVAFEPDQRNFDMLRRMTSELSLESEVTCVHAAVGAQEGEVKLWLNQTHHADHRVVTDSLDRSVSDDQQFVTVPLVSLDTYRKNNRAGNSVALIKIDVQGYEAGVCEGMKETLDQFPNALVIFEHSPASAEEMGFARNAVPDFFIERGYSLFVLKKRGKVSPVTVAELERSLGATGYIDVIASKNPLTLSSF